MTFPLMSAGIIRRYADTPGETLAMLYFTNSLGAAVGVLASGFVLIAAVGLPGTLQTNTPLTPGNCGGPLLNSARTVHSINTAIEVPNTARGIGYAVPSNVAQRVLPSLIAGSQVTRTWLGIQGVTLSQALAGTLNLTVSQGVYVVTVVSGSPADKAGLKAGGTDGSGSLTAGGDVITKVDGKAVTTIDGLAGYIAGKGVGDSVVLTVLRDGNSTTITATLAARPADTSTVTPGATPQTPANPRNRGGNGQQN